MGAPKLLRHLRDVGFAVTPADGGGIRVAPAGSLTDAHRRAIRDHRAELLSLLAAPLQPAPDPDRWCWPHSVAMNGVELAAFANRAQQFMRRGVSADDAEVMADRLVICDRLQDERRAAWTAAPTGPAVAASISVQTWKRPRCLAAMLQRCPGFSIFEVTT